MAKFVLSKSKLLERYNLLKKIGNVSFSLKTNTEIGTILENFTDSMFSVHTLENLKLINDKSRVNFLSFCWSEDEIKQLLDSGVRSFIVENKRDLNTLFKVLNVKINLYLRIRLKENTIFTGKYYVFGMCADEVNKLIPELRENEFINELGVHFHRKTQNLSEWSLKKEISEILNKKNLNLIDCINIGGGFPGNYKNTRDVIFNSIFSKINEFKDWLNKFNIKLVLEPGRFLSSYPIKLIANVKDVIENNVIIDCSIYNTAMDTILGPIKLMIEGEGEGKDYVVKGCTPCSMDIFRYKVKLNVKKGDQIIFLNAGAYNFSTDFCGLKKLKTDIVE